MILERWDLKENWFVMFFNYISNVPSVIKCVINYHDFFITRNEDCQTRKQ